MLKFLEKKQTPKHFLTNLNKTSDENVVKKEIKYRREKKCECHRIAVKL